MDVVARAIDRVHTLAAFCPEDRRLVHGDFGAFNVLSDGRRVTAVVDWGLAMFGDPLYDRANVFFWREDRMAPVLEQLRRRGGGSAYQARLQCYGLRIGLEELFLSAVGATPLDLDWLSARTASML